MNKTYSFYLKNVVVIINFVNLILKKKDMTVVIDKTNSKNISKILTEKLNKVSKKGNLAKHFGKLKRNIDGLKYQTEIRKDED